MNRLLEIGFGLAGHWHLEEGRLRIAIHQHGSQENVLYAFVCDGNVMYVGKSSKTLRQRMTGYMSHSASALTNVRVRQLIVDMLSAERSVDVYALPDNGLMHYGQFHLNLAAGLEDSIIKMISPPWNISGIGRMSADSASPDEQSHFVEDVDDEAMDSLDYPLVSIEITLQRTYRNSGFFNVPVAGSSAFGSDGENIEIFFQREQAPILGSINRRSNLNKTPRILGGPELRRRFQTLVEMSKLLIEIESPVSIRITSGASLAG